MRCIVGDKSDSSAAALVDTASALRLELWRFAPSCYVHQ
jgi:hypothetical protein